MAKSPKRVIATHIADLDGIGSASVLKRAFPDAEVYLIDYVTAERDFKRILKEKPDELYVADFNLGKGNEEAVKLVEQLSQQTEIYWYDHHNWDRKTFNRLSKAAKELLVDHSKCGTELVYERFLKGDDVAEKLASYARDTDFFENKHEHSRKLSDVISAKGGNKRFLIPFVSSLSQGELWNDDLQEIRTDYLRRRERKAEEAIQNAVLYKGTYKDEDLTIGVAYADRTLKAGYVGDLLRRWKGSDVSITLYENGSFSLRMKKKHEKKINLAEWARLFGGGGHRNASGAQYGVKITEDNLPEAMDDIVKKLPLKGPKKMKPLWEDLE